MKYVLLSALPPGLLAGSSLIAAAGDTTIPIGQILNVGLVGVFLLMSIFRFGLVPSWTLDDMKKQRDEAIATGNADRTRLIAERDLERSARNELETIVRDKYVPALESNKMILESVSKVLMSGVGK